MADDSLNSHLLLIDFSDSEASETKECVNPCTNGIAAARELTRAERTALSELAFQALKKSYRAKIENGEVERAPFSTNG